MDLFYEKRSEALSIYKNFATMIRTQFDTSIFVLILLGSIYLELFVSFFLSKALLLNSLVLVLMLRMVSLSVSIVICFRLLMLL